MLGALALVLAMRNPESEAAGIQAYRSPELLQELIREQHEAYLLIDVRTPAEFREGYIYSAANIPVDRIASTPPDVSKDHLIIVYCRTENRSAQARRTLESLGYTQIVDFGGINRWPYNLEGGL